jgi:hypothetical protein
MQEDNQPAQTQTSTTTEAQDPQSSVSAPPQPPTPEVSTAPQSQEHVKPKSNKILLVGVALLLLAIIGAAAYLFFQNQSSPTVQPTSYEECTKAEGSVIQESYPATCVTKDGNRFVQPISEEDEKEMFECEEGYVPLYEGGVFGGCFGDTSSWTTISSTAYPVQLKHPPNWSYYPNATNNELKLPYVRGFSETNETISDSSGCAIHIGTGGGSGPSNNITNETILIDGKSFTKKTWSENGKPVYISYLTEIQIPNFELLYAWISDENSTQCQATIDQILSTFEFKDTDPPSGWIDHSFTTLGLTLYTPSDWQSDSEEFPKTSSNLIRFWKKDSPDIVPIQLDIKSDWSNTGVTQDNVGNYSVGGLVSAYRVDPPTKELKELERYQTNVYFEYQEKVYVFLCVHNWVDDYLDTCNKMLETLKFN